MELIEVIVYVRNMQRAMSFYRDLLGLEVRYASDFWTTFATGPCTLALHATDQRERGIGEPDPTFLVADLDIHRERLLAAGVEVTEIREPGPGVRVFDARDPEGNRFSLESRIG